MNIAIGMGGLSIKSIVISLKCFPIVFIIAMIIETFIVGKIAEKVTVFFILPTDSFNAQILFRTFFTVIGMSIIMTIVGGSLGHGFNIELFKDFPNAWPRNFCVVIFWELIVVQPIARRVMVMIHKDQDEDNVLECGATN